MSSKTVHIGMPTRNRARFLEETLRSILGQSVGDLVLHVVDNASDDHTPDILHRLSRQDARLRVYRNAENIGLVPNFNRALALCEGDWVMLTGDDDPWREDRLKTLLDLRGKGDGISAVFTRWIDVDETGQIIDRPDTRKWNRHSPPDNRSLRHFYQYCRRPDFQMTYSLMPRTLIKNLDPFRGHGSGTGPMSDLFLVCHLLSHGEVRYQHEGTLFKRQLPTTAHAYTAHKPGQSHADHLHYAENYWTCLHHGAAAVAASPLGRMRRMVFHRAYRGFYRSKWFHLIRRYGKAVSDQPQDKRRFLEDLKTFGRAQGLSLGNDILWLFDRAWPREGETLVRA